MTAADPVDALRAQLARASALYVAAPAEALALAEGVIAALPTDAPPALRVTALRSRATALTFLGRSEDALALLAETFAGMPAHETALRLELQRAHSVAYEQLGALEEALDWAMQSVDSARTLGDPRSLADALLSVGVALSRSGDHGAGLERYREALAIYEAHRDDRGVLQALNNIGIGCKNLGRFDEAVVHVERAMAMAVAAGDEGARAAAASNLGEPLARLGRTAEARRVLADAVRGLAHAGYLSGETHARVMLGELLLADGELGAAQAEFEQALALTQRTGSRNHAARAHLGLSRVHKAAGRFEPALAQHEAYHAAERAQFNDDSARRLRAMQVRFDLQRARQDAELHRLRAAEMAAQSRTDALTGLANRRHLDERLADAVERASHDGRPLALALADIDDFKQVNDRLGHATGDEVLRTLADLLRAQARPADVVARYGGEEFCVAFVDTEVEEAAAACEALRAAVARHDWTALHPALRITLSIGLAGLAQAGTPAALLRTADHHLYDAKRRGKNQVRCGP